MDYHTGMNVKEISQCIYEYTLGYPYLVSAICELIDEKVYGMDKFPSMLESWTREGIAEVDYLGEPFIAELKIWRGNEYNERGEEQLAGYLEYFHLKKGYMLSFKFNKKKQMGIHEIAIGDKILVEAVV